MSTYSKHKAYTLVEVLLATSFAVILSGAFLLSFVSLKKTFSEGIAQQWLQDGASNILATMITGKTEPAGIYRLPEAESYDIASINELHFWGTDGVERWFTVNNTASSLIYHHPTASGTVDEVLYTAPAGAIITLRFSTPAGSQYNGIVIGIDVALTQALSGKTLSGAVSTYVNIRNHAT